MKSAITAYVLQLALLGATGAAQSIEDFDGWMQTIAEKNQAIQQHVAKRDAEAVAADAKALEEAFRLVEDFWVRRGDAPDAVTLSQEARQHAAGIQKAAADKNFESASTLAIRTAETCTACHRLYRPLP